jgi:hypothetical protein
MRQPEDPLGGRASLPQTAAARSSNFQPRTDAARLALDSRDAEERMSPRHPWSLATWVEWWGHQLGVILVPNGDGWYSEIPVLGVAR